MWHVSINNVYASRGTNNGKFAMCYGNTCNVKKKPSAILRQSLKTPGAKTVIFKMHSGHYMMTSSNGSMFHVTGPLWGESTGHRWIPLTKASDAELWCFLWSAPEQTFEKTVETPVIWDAIALSMTRPFLTKGSLSVTCAPSVLRNNEEFLLFLKWIL